MVIRFPINRWNCGRHLGSAWNAELRETYMKVQNLISQDLACKQLNFNIYLRSWRPLACRLQNLKNVWFHMNYNWRNIVVLCMAWQQVAAVLQVMFCDSAEEKLLQISALQVTASLIHIKAMKYILANLLLHCLSAVSLVGLDTCMIIRVLLFLCSE